MSPATSRVLLIVGAVLVVIAVISHFTLGVQIFPHFNAVLAVIGAILAVAGILGTWGYMVSKGRSS